MKGQQAGVEKALVKVISAPSPYPIPGRALRNLVARCLIVIYSRGDSRSLFDTLQEFLKIASDFKSLDKEGTKMCVFFFFLIRASISLLIVGSAAFSCIADLMEVFGSQVVSPAW